MKNTRSDDSDAKTRRRFTKSKTKRGSSSKPTNQSKPKGIAGLQARVVAARLVSDVFDRARSFDDSRNIAFESSVGATMSGPDKGLAQMIAATVVRMEPVLTDVINAHLNRPLPARHKAIRTILLCASAQLLFLKTPPHAAISLAVEQARRGGGKSPHLTGLVNAVLRKIAQHGPDMVRDADIPKRAIPDWLWRRWENRYGEPMTREIAHASLTEAALDITVKSDPESWAQRLEATVLKTGTLRREGGGRIEELEGFEDGAWWIQDAAAALPARLLGDVKGRTVTDLCAAPGGKTAQLASAGAHVIAVDIDQARLERVKSNLGRLNLEAQCIAADVLTWQPDNKLDRILLDAPCTATGTIRRHPDILRLKREADIMALAQRQSDMLNAAYAMLAKDGIVVYCTCSLEPEEGEDLINKFLLASPSARIVPIEPNECGIKPAWITTEGLLRSLPQHDPRDTDRRSVPPGDEQAGAASDHKLAQITGSVAGMDGFFAARIMKIQ